MQRLHWKMSNDATSDEKVPWRDPKKWGIVIDCYMIMQQ